MFRFLFCNYQLILKLLNLNSVSKLYESKTTEALFCSSGHLYLPWKGTITCFFLATVWNRSLEKMISFLFLCEFGVTGVLRFSRLGKLKCHKLSRKNNKEINRISQASLLILNLKIATKLHKRILSKLPKSRSCVVCGKNKWL